MRNYDFKHRAQPRRTRTGVGFTQQVDGRERLRGTDPARHFTPSHAGDVETPDRVYVPLEGGGVREVVDARD